MDSLVLLMIELSIRKFSASSDRGLESVLYEQDERDFSINMEVSQHMNASSKLYSTMVVNSFENTIGDTAVQATGSPVNENNHDRQTLAYISWSW